MNKLDKYIILNYIKSFFLGMMMFFLIFILAESINLTGWIMDGKFTLGEAFKYLSYGVPEIITNTAPLGILLGSLLAISKMAKQLEITAMKTSGISFLRIAKFPLIFSFIISISVLFINIDILGKSNSKKSNMKLVKLEQGEPVKAEKNFVLVKIDKNKVLYSGYVNKKDGIMREIEIIEMTDGFKNIKTVYTATSAVMQKGTDNWTFENLKEHNIATNVSNNIDSANFKFKVPIDDILADPVKAKNLTMPELREKIVYFSRVGADSIDLLIDFYYRISFSLASFVMCFIGLSLGSRYVRGGAAVNIGLSVIIGYSYYGFSTILKSIASAGTMPVYIACFLPLLIYLGVGIKLFIDAEY
jgi:permease, yjgP/yjgQ family